MKQHILTTILIAAMFALPSCMKEYSLYEIPLGGERITFVTEGIQAEVATKVSETTISTLQSNGFNVSATTGSAGSEVSAWNNVAFSRSGSVYVGNKYWPASDPAYHFYASNLSLTHGSSGCTVSATNSTDVVCAYLSSSTYKSQNTLSFQHIFARLCRVDVVAESGYTISGINVRITPKTGGTYNLRTGAGQTDGTGWSGVTTGSATQVASTTGANNNDIYLVPGIYTITCTWTSTKSGASVTHTNEVCNIQLVAGKTNNVSVVLGGDIMLGVDLQDYADYDYRDNLDYLTFYCDEAGTIGWKCSNASVARTIQYSKDFGATWTDLTSTTSGATVSVNAGDIVWFKGSNTEYATSYYYNQFELSNRAHVYGNVNSLTENNTSVSENCFCKLFNNCSNLYTYKYKKIILPATTLAPNCYESMFSGCTSLTNAPALPATSLASFCYRRMFQGCTSLTVAPELPAMTLAANCYENMFSQCSSLRIVPALPATSLAEGCYYNMFRFCTSLTTAPALPATSLAQGCYFNMFYACTSLTTAPTLPATMLTDYCYQFMFAGCTSLTTAPALPATSLAQGCYNGMFYVCSSLTTAPALPATTLAPNCYENMFSDCTSLTSVPELPATTLAPNCYFSMFSYCSSLTTAPELPARALVDNCYSSMFRNCSSLNYIKALFLSTPSNSTTYTSDWVSGVASTGTFVKSEDALWKFFGNNGVPRGWSVYTESADPTNPRNATFGGLKIAQGPLYYNGSTYAMYNYWNHESYNKFFGKKTGSTYFSFLEMGELFEKAGFSYSDGSIENLLNPFNGWRLPTISEWCTLTTGESPGTTRSGSKVNGINGVKYARIRITGVSHASYVAPYGILLFPDNKIITGKTLSGTNNSTITNGVTESELDVYLSQGCVFLPASGNAFSGGGTECSYWTSSEDGFTNAYEMFCSSSVSTYNSSDKQNMYCSVRLVHDAD